MLLPLFEDDPSSKPAETCRGSGLSVSDRLRENVELRALPESLYPDWSLFEIEAPSCLFSMFAFGVGSPGGFRCDISKEDGGIICHYYSLAD